MVIVAHINLFNKEILIHLLYFICSFCLHSNIIIPQTLPHLPLKIKLVTCPNPRRKADGLLGKQHQGNFVGIEQAPLTLLLHFHSPLKQSFRVFWKIPIKVELFTPIFDGEATADFFDHEFLLLAPAELV